MTSTPDFDAIVVGSGVSGGWAAKELTEKGLKVLMLDRGRMVEHGRDYTTEHQPNWQFPLRTKVPQDLYDRDHAVHKNLYLFNESNRHFFNNDRENPYLYEPGGFLWFRGGVVGGRSLTWGKQTYRWCEMDFEANKLDGKGIDWPIRYKDIAPWYSYVEKFIGVSGEALNLPQLPDSEFLPPMEMTVVEKAIKHDIEREFPGRHCTIGRCAVLTKPHNGRGACHYCGPCERGCSVGAYFSTQSTTLPAARKTNNLTLKSDCVVAGIDYDPATKRATAVNVIDANTKERYKFSAKLIFLCASTVGSTQILMNSRSEAFPNGLANRSGALGHYMMDHTLSMGARGIMPGYEDKVPYGNRPNGVYIPRFRNLNGQDEDANFVRGYGYQGYSGRVGWAQLAKTTAGFGKDFKQSLRTPGPWTVVINGFGECLPYKSNRMELVQNKLDPYGIPQIKFHFDWGNNERNMCDDVVSQAVSMLEKSGVQHVEGFNNHSVGGEGIHEMGTARMGHSPTDSVLNKWNQAHDVPNLFVTDGSCMTSSSCVNPSLTYMALTARAADYAVQQLKAGKL